MPSLSPGNASSVLRTFFPAIQPTLPLSSTLIVAVPTSFFPSADLSSADGTMLSMPVVVTLPSLSNVVVVTLPFSNLISKELASPSAAIISAACRISPRVLISAPSLDFSIYCMYWGTRTAASTPMMAMTTISSTRVKPFLDFLSFSIIIFFPFFA